MQDVIIRNYSVVLMADANTAHDPVKVSLSFTPDDAQRIGRDSKEAHREAFDLAVRRERAEYQVTSDRTFLNGGTTCLRERLVQSDTPAYNRMRTAIKRAATETVKRSR